MNKKILSCALVAAMLASSVGAMGVSAANDDAFEKVTFTAPNLNAAAVDLSNIYTGTFEDAMDEKVFTSKAHSNNVYLFNYTGADQTDTTSAKVTYDEMVEAIEDAKIAGDVNGQTPEGDDNSLYRAAVTKMAKYYSNADFNGTWNDVVKADDGLSLTNPRKTAVADADANKTWFKDSFDVSSYDQAELKVYNIEALEDAYKALNVETATTAELMYLNYEYDRLLGENGLLSTNTYWEDVYAEKLADAEALTEDDYTASNWAKVEYQMRLAELEAEKGTSAGYKAACDALNVIFDTIKTVKPDYSALEDAVEGLFKEKVSPVDGIYPGTSAAGCIYLKNDYKDGKNIPDEWYEFAGYKDIGDEDYIKGAYRAAYEVYEKCQRASTRKYVAQSTVDKVLEDLNDAILALDPNYETSNWVIVMLEDALEVANNVVEDDFRTSSSYWKTFVKDKEYIEKLLEQDSVKEKVAKAAVEALLGDDMDATKGKDGSLAKLSNCKLTVSTATKNALKDAIKEAKDLLEDKTGKTSSQITTLQNALDDAEEIDNDNTISEYENATTTLEDAMTNYEHPQGWYKDNNGTWFYGKEGDVAKGWLNVNGVWYLLDSETGAMKTGWQQVNGTWYYMNASGAMQTGWLNLNGTYYYLESWGGMATGWKSVNGSWYYLQPSSGAMVANGWYWINGKCYYFYNWGGMAANTTIDGYKVDASGAWVK